jgi:hypothetical protein
MSWLRYFRRRYWDQERSRELQAYLDIETDENIARGMPPEEARYADAGFIFSWGSLTSAKGRNRAASKGSGDGPANHQLLVSQGCDRVHTRRAACGDITGH